MALMYPWATKEYLLWEMSLSQIILYHNLGHELKYGKQEPRNVTAKDMSYEKLKQIRDELRAQYGEIGGNDV